MKANFGAHICLSTIPFASQPYIEFVIGLETSTSQLRVRDPKSFLSHHTVSRANLLNESEFRGFWISFEDGVSIFHYLVIIFMVRNIIFHRNTNLDVKGKRDLYCSGPIQTLLI